MLTDRLTLALLDQWPGAAAVLDTRDEALPVVLVNQPLAELRATSAEAVSAAGLAGLLGEGVDSARIADLRRVFIAGDSVSLQVALTDPMLGPYSAELRFQPLHDETGTVTHYAVFHDRIGLPPARGDALPTSRPPLARDDRLTGLRHIELFHEFYRRDFAIAQREGRALAVFVFDIDALGIYNATFGRAAGDTVIRRVGRSLLSGLRRASDLVARVEGGRFVGLAAGMDAEQAQHHAQLLGVRVRELHLHHPRSPIARVVTVCCGVAQMLPGPDSTPDQLLHEAQLALEDVRAKRGNAGAMGLTAPGDG